MVQQINYRSWISTRLDMDKIKIVQHYGHDLYDAVRGVTKRL
jgi:hypothetical protein